MRKTTKESQLGDNLNLNYEEGIQVILAFYGVTISKSNSQNYKQCMKKPFIGWIMGLTYNPNTDYEAMLIQDCISFARTKFIEEHIENFRNHFSDEVLREMKEREDRQWKKWEDEEN